MIIAIDGYEANQKTRVGSGRYAFELLKYIHKYIHTTSDNLFKETFFRIYIPHYLVDDMPEETVKWKYRIIYPKFLWTFLGLPMALSSDFPRANVVFSPTHYIPRFISTSRVMTIMDISYLRFPSLFRRQDLHKLIHGTAYAAHHAKKIITISKSSANDIIDLYNKKREDISITYPGFTMIQDIEHADIVASKYHLSKRYILSVGTLQPRKNYEKLIEAFSLLVQQNNHQDLHLYIVGKRGWLYEKILSAPAKFGIEDRVTFLDYVPDKDLPQLYRGAVCFALPSLYEGFGLPVLEAMSQGCPVVVSNRSSLPEIAGNAGILVDPNQVQSIMNGLQIALMEDGTEKRTTRVEKGKEHIKMFSWEKAANQTLKILTEVGGSK